MSRLCPILHSRLPPLGQDLVLSAHRWLTRRSRRGPGFERVLDRLAEARERSYAEIEREREQRLSEVLRHAARHSSWWRERLARAGVDAASVRNVAELAELPLLSRAAARHAGDRLFSDAFRRSRLHSLWTSGTSGAPLQVRLTPEALRLQWATWWRQRLDRGVSLDARTLTFGARLPPLGRAARRRVHRRDLLTGDAYVSVHELTTERLDRFVDWLAGERFALHAGYPSSLAVVARALRERGRRLSTPPQLVACGSETLDPETERLLHEVFEAPVADHYGLTEACGNFTRCREGSYHEDPELGVAELLPVPGAEDPRLRLVVFTGLANLAMPLIRYAPGDLAVERDGPCPCGRPGRTLERVEGRAEDLLRTPDGRRVGGLNQALKWARGAEAVQLVQSALDRVEARVLAGADWSEDSGERLLEELRARLGPEVSVELRLVDELPPGRGGKRRAVVCELPADRESGT